MRWWAVMLVVLATGLASGGGVYLGVTLLRDGRETDPREQHVTAIRIELQKYLVAQSQGNRIDVPKLLSLNPFSKPDLFLVIQLRDGQTIRTPTHHGMPIGNGLRWRLETPIPLGAIDEVQVHHEGWFRNRMMDRVLVSTLHEEGALFNFAFSTDPVDDDVPVLPNLAADDDRLETERTR